MEQNAGSSGVAGLSVSQSRADAAAWNAFAAFCGASFRCAYNGQLFWQLKHHAVFHVERVEIHCCISGNMFKIAQCAIGRAGDLNVFADSLQLLPEYAGMWGAVMSAILAWLGPGRYQYGSRWNIEPPRDREFAAIPGVGIESNSPFIVDVVDFAEFASWSDYLRRISNNARRNAKRAIQADPALVVRVRVGLETLRDGLHIARHVAGMIRRKNLGGGVFRSALKSFARLLTTNHLFTALALSSDGVKAVFTGVAFGANTYYLAGGSAERESASWFLLLNVIERAYERGASGKFLFGVRPQEEPGSEGVLFSRRQCRARPYSSSVVVFSYQPTWELYGGVQKRVDGGGSGNTASWS